MGLGAGSELLIVFYSFQPIKRPFIVVSSRPALVLCQLGPFSRSFYEDIIFSFFFLVDYKHADALWDLISERAAAARQAERLCSQELA